MSGSHPCNLVAAECARQNLASSECTCTVGAGKPNSTYLVIGTISGILVRRAEVSSCHPLGSYGSYWTCSKLWRFCMTCNIAEEGFCSKNQVGAEPNGIDKRLVKVVPGNISGGALQQASYDLIPFLRAFSWRIQNEVHQLCF